MAGDHGSSTKAILYAFLANLGIAITKTGAVWSVGVEGHHVREHPALHGATRIAAHGDHKCAIVRDELNGRFELVRGEATRAEVVFPA